MPTNSIRSFAILDIETSNIPEYNYGRANITEISIYGVCATDISDASPNIEPRVLHKLTLLFNPRLHVHPSSERVTGLNNFLLENESHFDENSANVIIGFLNRLQQPTCLVAHNGINFDFPIIKTSFHKLGMELPSSIKCVDSLIAFQELDETFPSKQMSRSDIIADIEKELAMIECNLKSSSFISEIQKLNETTPKRSPVSDGNVKRKQIIDCEKKPTELAKRVCVPEKPIACRSLFPEATSKITPPKKKYPPKNVYKLGNIYKRIFNESPVLCHHAEADVQILQKIILHYGKRFVEYAEVNSIPFAEVQLIAGARK